MQQDDRDGTWSFARFVLKASSMTREDFLREHRAPMLVQYTEPGSTSPISSSFGTLSISRAATRAVQPLRVHSLAKRSGNPFTAMITIGRASNNDIILPYEEISKFHAFFLEGPSGWALADAQSMNGTWLTGGRLEANKPSPIPVGALEGAGVAVTFSGVKLVLHSPERLYELAVAAPSSMVA
ncbi:MAG: FHA domain-containing protein [Planctomycetota bacterium]